MSLFKFTKGILNKQSIPLFNKGNHVRDFTYVDDVVEGIKLILGNHQRVKCHLIFLI